uniref:Ig-like domain-containing protein n=1 Tax=Cyprinodon variegatus TaxID=28743 RepID=A0A3Q2FV25_CYPVA
PDIRPRLQRTYSVSLSSNWLLSENYRLESQYQFTIKTNNGRSYTSSPGVSLSVTALQVKVRKLEYTNSYCRVELRCQSSCQPKHQSYIWIKNGQEILRETSSSVFVSVYPADKYSCALEGYKEFPSPSVYAPQLPSVSISPSGEIVENRKVILTCSSDANPAANYSWYKEDKQKPVSNESQLIFSSIQASDTGKYHCVAANPLGRKRCQQKHINVKYAPRLPSVLAIPSGETGEGSSVTLTCSSDANPGATYTWYKEGDKSPKASGQNFVISNVRPEHSGSYSCVAQNTRGRQSFSVHLTVVKDPSVKIMNIIRLTLVVLMLIPVVVLCLWTR